MILAWQNHADAATITAGSQIGTLPATNLQHPHVVKKWHSAAGVKATHLLVDMGAPVACSLLALLGSNLSSSATVRMRASLTDAEADAALQLDTGKMPAGSKSGYGGVYKRVRGRYLSLSDSVSPSLAFDFTAGHMADLIGRASVTFTRAGTATCVNALGQVAVVATDTPRFDHDPNTGECKGLLVEVSRTNLVLQSDDFSVSPWATAVVNGGGASTWNNIPSRIKPSGNAVLVARTAASGGLRQSISVASSTRHIMSAYLERVDSRLVSFQTENGGSAYGGGGSLTLDLVTGQITFSDFVVAPIVQKFKSGWVVKVDLGVSGATAGRVANLEWFLNSNNPGFGGRFILENPQLEAGGFATSYIPTVASSVTRSADVATVSDLSGWFSAPAGTLLAEASVPVVPDLYGPLAVLDNGTSAEILADFALIGTQSPTPFAGRFTVRDGDVTQVDITGAASVTANTIYRLAAAYQANNFAIALGGSLLGTDSSGTLGTPTQLTLGHRLAGDFLNGHLRRFTYYGSRQANDDLTGGTRAEAPTIEVERDDILGRYWRIDLEDTTLADNIQVGRLYLGPHWKPSVNMLLGWSVTPEDRTPLAESTGLQTYPDTKPKQRVLDFTLDFMGEQEMYENAFALAREAGVVKDVLAIPVEEGAYLSEQAVYGQCMPHRPLEEPQLELYRQKFTIRERL